MSRVKMILTFSLLTAVFLAYSQKAIPFSAEDWQYEGDYQIEEYKGKTSLHLQAGARAVLPAVQFRNGTITFSLAFSGQRGFMGLGFRMQDDKNFEEFYFRPHNTQQPDAMQYTPVFNGISAWQLYYGDGYGTAYDYPYEQWMQVKLLIRGNEMEVYINDMEEPVLYTAELKRQIQSGYLSLYTNLTDTRFADFSYDAEVSPKLKKTSAAMAPMPEGTIADWQVSQAVSWQWFDGAPTLPTAVEPLSWQSMKAENSGTVNLAKRTEKKEKQNTVLAKFMIDAPKAGLRRLHFGYSDEVVIFCNGTALYQGQRRYRSRDHRYLGTIGYFDSVFLPLLPGKNEIVFAVKENFGGWGIRARVQ